MIFLKNSFPMVISASGTCLASSAAKFYSQFRPQHFKIIVLNPKSSKQKCPEIYAEMGAGPSLPGKAWKCWAAPGGQERKGNDTTEATKICLFKKLRRIRGIELDTYILTCRLSTPTLRKICDQEPQPLDWHRRLFYPEDDAVIRRHDSSGELNENGA